LVVGKGHIFYVAEFPDAAMLRLYVGFNAEGSML
jgi:hypothetical protein